MSRFAAAARRALALAALAGVCAPAPAPAGASSRYRPRTREVTLTAVPLLTREMRRIYPFLAADFATGGVLEGKEVYAFVPGTVTAVEGDTLALTLVNPEDDAHSFVLPDTAIGMPPQSTVRTRYVARRAGIYPFVCSIPTHLPFMHGTLVVLPAAAFAAP